MKMSLMEGEDLTNWEVHGPKCNGGDAKPNYLTCILCTLMMSTCTAMVPRRGHMKTAENPNDYLFVF